MSQPNSDVELVTCDTDGWQNPAVCYLLGEMAGLSALAIPLRLCHL
jgi:hypothetical protein